MQWPIPLQRADGPVAILGTVPGPSVEELRERVFRILRDDILAADGDFGPRSNLVDAGLDSLAVTQLMLAVEEDTGVWIDESLLTPENLESAETLAALVHERLAGASQEE